MNGEEDGRQERRKREKEERKIGGLKKRRKKIETTKKGRIEFKRAKTTGKGVRKVLRCNKKVGNNMGSDGRHRRKGIEKF